MRNQGVWLALLCVCGWPLIVASAGIWMDRRIRESGLESLIPRRWRKQQ